MAFDVVAATYRTKEKELSPLRRTLTTGLVFGLVCVYCAVVGLLLMFHGRWIIAEVLTLGQALLIVIALCAGIQVARKTTARSSPAIAVQGLASGAIAGAVLSLLVIIMSLVKLRFMFIALSPQLFKMLTFDLGTVGGVVVLIGAGALFGLWGALLYITPPSVRRPLVIGLTMMGFIGLFQDLIQLMMQQVEIVDKARELLFTWDGLKWQSAIGIVIVVAAVMAVWMRNRDQVRDRFGQLAPVQQKGARLIGIVLALLLILVVFPLVAGNFIGQVLLFISLFILMGMGLNLEIGLAGLLDLGFVAFFAVGAYTTALLTADSPYALAQNPLFVNWVGPEVASWFHMSFWEALPIAVLMALLIGVLFGVPVLRIRGDYLAVATLGLGEIVRVLVLSDFAAPVLAGAQGVLNIPRPSIGELQLDDPVDLYFVALGACAVAAYFAWRLENSRLGRAWTAIRDDEDVAQALGINLVNVKLLAYGLGAAFAGVAGAIFAVMLTTIYPHSFQLLISINVLALIIVGGMGSLPGVVLGALVLIGLPELLREFGEYRFLFYGFAIVAVMRIRPSGLWPSVARRREMQTDVETQATIEAELQPLGSDGGISATAPRSPHGES